LYPDLEVACGLPNPLHLLTAPGNGTGLWLEVLIAARGKGIHTSAGCFFRQNFHLSRGNSKSCRSFANIGGAAGWINCQCEFDKGEKGDLIQAVKKGTV
jgi:hypothetical protein